MNESKPKGNDDKVYDREYWREKTVASRRKQGLPDEPPEHLLEATGRIFAAHIKKNAK